MAKQKTMSATPRRRVGTVLGTGFFAILSLIIIFPVFAGLLASFMVFLSNVESKYTGLILSLI